MESSTSISLATDKVTAIHQEFMIDAVQLISHAVFDLPDAGDTVAILCHFNPCLYISPVRNLAATLDWLLAEELPTYAIELRCGHSVSAPPVLPVGHRKVLQLTSDSWMFVKDNLWNVLAKNLPAHFSNIICVDADVSLRTRGWKKTLADRLGSFPVVQPFSRGVWLDSIGNVFKEKYSCGYAANCGLPTPHLSKEYHCGFAVAVRRDFWAETGGFFNSPVGGGSLFLMSATLGVENELEPILSSAAPAFARQYREWADRVRCWSHQRLGHVDGDAYHLWHGSRAKRRYFDRFELLSGFDPFTDVESKPSGLHEWSPVARTTKQTMLRRIEDYFKEREEDEHVVP